MSRRLAASGERATQDLAAGGSESIRAVSDVVADAVVIEPDVVVASNNGDASVTASVVEPQDVIPVASEFVADSETATTYDDEYVVATNTAKTEIVDESMADYRGVVAEVISDDDFDTVFGDRDVAVAEEVDL